MATSSPDAAILDRIQKLFQLADPARGATENEIKTALEKAELLMTRYNIDRSRLPISGESEAHDRSFGKTSIPLSSRLSRKLKSLFSLLQAATPIRVLFDKSTPSPVALLLGSKTDLLYAEFLYSYLSNVFDSLWLQHRRQRPDSHQTSYFQGLHDGILLSIQQGKKKAEEELKSNERTSYDIVLRDEAQALQKFIFQEFGRTRKARSQSSIRDGDSYHSGRHDGQNVQLQRPLADR